MSEGLENGLLYDIPHILSKARMTFDLLNGTK